MSSTNVPPAPHVWRPARARTVVLDGFAPVPRGATSGTLVPLSWPAKDPADVLDYQFDIAAALAGNEGDGIASVTAEVSPAGTGDLSVTSVAADGTVAILWMAGGRNGVIYTVEINVSTLAGRTVNRAVFLPVVSLAEGLPPDTSLLTDLGLVVTDEHGNPILLGS
jgi:hypothetical protein